MKFLKLISLLLIIVTINAKPQSKDRVHDPELSDIDHNLDDDDDHNYDYDHEAFLGKEEASKYNDLSPEESKERLGKIVDKMDKNNDGKISPEEIKEWLIFTTQRYLREDTDRNWKDYKIENDKLSFENYKKVAYQDDEDKEHIKRDERRWAAADLDGDKLLTKEEFFTFLHPEETDRMRNVVIQETMDDLDKNKDGFVDINEYISDMWSPDKPDEAEPDWVKTERTSFTEQRDKNKDGKLDFEEVGEWILPNDKSYILTETKHLMDEADVDKDGFLTKQEVLDKYSVFVGSQATDYGEALNRHTEL